MSKTLLHPLLSPLFRSDCVFLKHFSFARPQHFKACTIDTRQHTLFSEMSRFFFANKHVGHSFATSEHWTLLKRICFPFLRRSTEEEGGDILVTPLFPLIFFSTLFSAVTLSPRQRSRSRRIWQSLPSLLCAWEPGAGKSAYQNHRSLSLPLLSLLFSFFRLRLCIRDHHL